MSHYSYSYIPELFIVSRWGLSFSFSLPKNFPIPKFGYPFLYFYDHNTYVYYVEESTNSFHDIMIRVIAN